MLDTSTTKTTNSSKWEAAISKSKEIYTTRNSCQMEVARLAMEVCEISWGGPRSTNQYTLTRFARESGIGFKSLSLWVSTRKLVYDKLPEPLVRDATFTALARTARVVNHDTSASVIKEKFEEVANRSNLDKTVSRYLTPLRALSSAFVERNASIKASPKTLSEVLFYCDIITKRIRRDNPKISPKDFNIAAKNDIRYISAAQAFGLSRKHRGRVKIASNGRKINLTEKDRKIIHFMKSKKKWFTPTELGMKLGNHNANSASAWACRTLYKLVDLDAVERNNKGHYRWSAS